MKATHVQEIDRLRREKEDLLRSEAHDTQAGSYLVAFCHRYWHWRVVVMGPGALGPIYKKIL